MKPVLNFKIDALHKKVTIKKREENKVSRLCLATIILDKGVYKAKVDMLNDDENSDLLIINLSKESFYLNDKRKIYSKKRDEYNHYVLYLRNETSLNLWHPDPNKYSTVCENLCVSGNVIKIKGELQFKIKDSHGFASNPQDLPVRLDRSRPLF